MEQKDRDAFTVVTGKYEICQIRSGVVSTLSEGSCVSMATWWKVYHVGILEYLAC